MFTVCTKKPDGTYFDDKEIFEDFRRLMENLVHTAGDHYLIQVTRWALSETKEPFTIENGQDIDEWREVDERQEVDE